MHLALAKGVLLTWIGHDDEARLPEIAVPPIPPVGLIVEIHGNGRMVYQVIGIEAGAALLKNLAIHLRACEVDVCQQSCLV